jgi:peptide deformylase
VILHVATLGHPVLRRRAETVAAEDIDRPLFQAFVDDLLESMHHHDGVGLAAPQVFRSQRLVAAWVPAEMDAAGAGLAPAVYINPELSPLDEELEAGWEGCLSLKDLRGVVPRHRRVRLRALDRRGRPLELELSGFAARVLQHEVDHLDGVVFTDRMADMSSLCFESELQRQGAAGDGDED